MPEAETLADARREFEICNACRYCEGFCAVFPAMMRRRSFDDGDLAYLANLCHGCKGCFYACQYAPPHPFGVNVPKTLASLRTQTYEAYAWPAPVGRAFRRNGLVLALVTAAGIALALALLFALSPGAATASHRGPGAFYAVVPWAVMAGVAGAALGVSFLVLLIGAARFWRETGGGRPSLSAVVQAKKEALSLRYLGGGHAGHDGCNDTGEAFSQARRRAHHALMYGFFLCFASTSVAYVYDHWLGRAAPYPLFSLPVILGTLGGVAMMVGAAGLFWLKLRADPEPTAPETLGADFGLIALLFAAAASGLLLLGLRESAAMPTLLAVHLGVILALFLTLPYSKMVHALYRTLALTRNAAEQRGEITPRPRFEVTRSGRAP